MEDDVKMGIVVIDKSIEKCKSDRGIYGIFVCKDGESRCHYVGKSEAIKNRAKRHEEKIKNKDLKHIQSLKKAFNDEQEATILIKLLKEVPYRFDNYYKDAQRLASAENRWIDKFQKMEQCLEQVPEGKRPSEEKWKKLKEQRR